MLTRILCTARQLLRRWSWFIAVVGGLLLYPLQQLYLIRQEANAARTAATVEALKNFPFKTSAEATAALATIDEAAAQAAAQASAKVVDVLQVYSKFSIAVGAFCLLNFLAWAALNTTVDVLPDWAKGYYKQQRADLPQQPGFKGTFLRLSHAGRMAVYLAGWGLQLAAAGLSIWAAFQIQ